MDVGIGCVVNDDYLAHFPVEHPQVLDVHALTLVAVLAEQAVMNELPLRIQIIQDHIRIGRMTRSKNYNFKVF